MAVPEDKPPVPANSVWWGVEYCWDGKEYLQFIEKTRQCFGESWKEFFLATTATLSLQNAAVRDGSDSNGAWAVPVGTLGVGPFGTVTKVDIPTLGTSYYAVKTLKEVVRFSFQVVLPVGYRRMMAVIV